MNLRPYKLASLVKFCLVTIVQLLLLFFSFIFLLAYLYHFDFLHQPQSVNNVELELFSLFNSDFIQPFLIIQDALRDIDSLNHWVFSPALYIFPDWLISLALILTGITNKLLPIFYGAAIMTLNCLAAGMLITKCSRPSSNTNIWLWTWVMALLICITGGFILIGPYNFLSYYMLVWISSSYIHSGAVLMTIVSAVCWLCLFQDQSKINRFFTIGVLFSSIFFSSFSDFIFVVWFVLPAILVTLLHHWQTKKFRLMPYFFIIIPTILAIGLEVVIRQKSPDSRAHHSGSFALWLSDMTALISSTDYPMLILLTLNVFLLIKSCAIVLSFGNKKITSSLLLEQLLGAILVCAITIPLLLGLYRGYALWRYYLIIFILPLLWIALMLARYIRKSVMNIGIAAFALVLTAACLTYPQAQATLTELQKTTDLESCLLQNGLTSGYGDYWHAKSLIFSSNRQIHIAQLLGPKPYPFNFNARWFSERSDTREPFKPNFVIIENLDPALINQLFGAPQEHLRCQNKLIWKYDHALALLPIPK